MKTLILLILMVLVPASVMAVEITGTIEMYREADVCQIMENVEMNNYLYMGYVCIISPRFGRICEKDGRYLTIKCDGKVLVVTFFDEED